MAPGKIRNFRDFQNSLRDFDFLKSAVPGASDIDLIVHCEGRNGDRFLVIEGKRPRSEVSVGQRRLHDALRRSGFTVVVATGPDSEKNFVLSGDWTGTVSKDGLMAKCFAWFNEAKLYLLAG